MPLGKQESGGLKSAATKQLAELPEVQAELRDAEVRIQKNIEDAKACREIQK